MIKGIGIDLIELQRVEKIVETQPKLITRILTADERTLWEQLGTKRRIEFLAGRFAAKEALSKALGTGVGADFSWQDVSILPDHNGAPKVIWDASKLDVLCHVSISHSDHYAVAQVIIEEKK